MIEDASFEGFVIVLALTTADYFFDAPETLGRCSEQIRVVHAIYKSFFNGYRRACSLSENYRQYPTPAMHASIAQLENQMALLWRPFWERSHAA